MITIIFTILFYLFLTYGNLISFRATSRISNMWYSLMWKMDIIINQLLFTGLSGYLILKMI